MQTYIVRSRAVIIHDGKLLVVRHAGGRDFYALPGGHLEPNESPKECIERELIEELGIKPKVGRLLYIYTYTNKEDVHAVEFFFEIENGMDYLLHADVEKTHAHEIDEVRWVSTEDQIKVLPTEFQNEFTSGVVLNDETRFLKG
ncbi:MAG: NUDIX hydrolase [Candidatus Pacebacteria bacterium]|nr:NUDIX hydrolase [Candidatus Paceibacterota bacterium]MCF7857612.1 NUDIX hydrolase [Candidatus Paceibacterota bacterium]